jgi:predicted regulator of Ras-like GTPase activity (Roadblock/LC7/MglB family)
MSTSTLQTQVFATSMDNPKPAHTATGTHAKTQCQTVLASLVGKSPAIQFASVALVDGRSFAHANSASHDADPQRSAALMSSLLGLVESFSREALGCKALYNSTATEHGSIVIVRVPTRAQMHTLCICADASDNLAMTIRTALDTAAQLALLMDAGH